MDLFVFLFAAPVFLGGDESKNAPVKIANNCMGLAGAVYCL